MSTEAVKVNPAQEPRGSQANEKKGFFSRVWATKTGRFMLGLMGAGVAAGGAYKAVEATSGGGAPSAVELYQEAHPALIKITASGNSYVSPQVESNQTDRSHFETGLNYVIPTANEKYAKDGQSLLNEIDVTDVKNEGNAKTGGLDSSVIAVVKFQDGKVALFRGNGSSPGDKGTAEAGAIQNLVDTQIPQDKQLDPETLVQAAP